MSSTTEIKEQIKELKSQEKQAKMLLNRKNKDYQKYKMLMEEHPVFAIITEQERDRQFDSFEELVEDSCWRNTKFDKTDWEFMFLELGYKDTEFFNAFMSWDKDIHFERCCICYDYYNNNKPNKKQQKMRNCSHHSCYTCYLQLKTVDEYRICMICRESEKPKL